MKISTYLVDDERKAIEILKDKIERFCPELNIIGSSRNPDTAIDEINKLKPELVFLDVTMPEKSGFDLLQQFEVPFFEIIFATAHDEYAIQAINHCAIGYLLKPIDNSELQNAVKNSIENIKNKSALSKNTTLLSNLNQVDGLEKKIAIPCSEGLEFLKLKEILFCQGEDGYTKIHLKNKSVLLSSNSIGYFRKTLEKQNFYLTHKSFLVNMNFIQKYLNEGYVVLEGDHSIPVARSKRQEFTTHLRSQL